jgi:hypothetical protein
VGEVMTDTPAEIGRALGLPDALSTARAVRALIARRRLEPANGSYRLLDARPVDAGEKESIGERAAGGSLGYSDLGRAVADKVVELGRENAQLRAEARQLREETRDARARMDEAERRARSASERARELEGRAEMAESNLRSLLASARGSNVRSDAPVGDAEMAAILGVLKGEEAEAGGVSPSGASGDHQDERTETGDELPEPTGTPATG